LRGWSAPFDGTIGERLWNGEGRIMTQQTPKDTFNQLKNIDFLSWQVTRAKSNHQEREITKIMSDRPRQRSDAHMK
jgi:hypothetical protein